MTMGYDWSQQTIRTGEALMDSPCAWVEAYPREPMDEADAGGDVQDGTAWGRRFVYWHSESGLFAVLNVYHYAASDDVSDGAGAMGPRWVQRQVELVVCSDYADPGSTELYADYEFVDVPCAEGQHSMALQLAQSTTVAALPLSSWLWAQALPHLQPV